MPDYKQNYTYDLQPGADTKQTWLGTRKRSYFTGNIQFPGFYQSVDVQKDFGWFVMALIIEMAALSLTLYGGFTKGGVLILASIIIIILFIVLDFFGVILMHMNKENKCLCTNRFILEPEQKPIISLQYEKGRWKEYVGFIFLILSSLLKIFAILLLGTFSNILFFVVLGIFYLCVIYIHSSHTGYWLAEYKTGLKMNRDFKAWQKDKSNFAAGTIVEEQIRHQSIRNTSVFISTRKLENITLDRPKEFCRHKISLIEETERNGKNEFKYEIATYGILMDSEIVQCTSGHLPEDGNIIGKACVKHQLLFHQQ